MSRYEAYMDSTSLSSLDSSIRVLDIQPADVSPSIRTVRIANIPGALVTNKMVEKSSVTIFFEIHKYSTSDRIAVCQKVHKWAKGTFLTTSDRSGQRLHAVCESYPNPNAKGWTEPLSITFSGYAPPFWEETTAVTKTILGSGTESLVIPGTEEAFVSAAVTVTGSATSMTFTVDGKSIVLSGLTTVANDVIALGYNNQILYVNRNNTSIRDKVTASSADVLKVQCGGTSSLHFESDGTCSCAYSIRGCWL